MLFAFDRKRKAILLVGGDKSDNWKAWYEINVPIADDRFDEHQARIAPQQGTTKPTKSTPRSSKGKGRR